MYIGQLNSVKGGPREVGDLRGSVGSSFRCSRESLSGKLEACCSMRKAIASATNAVLQILWLQGDCSRMMYPYSWLVPLLIMAIIGLKTNYAEHQWQFGTTIKRIIIGNFLRVDRLDMS